MRRNAGLGRPGAISVSHTNRFRLSHIPRFDHGRDGTRPYRSRRAILAGTPVVAATCYPAMVEWKLLPSRSDLLAVTRDLTMDRRMTLPVHAAVETEGGNVCRAHSAMESARPANATGRASTSSDRSITATASGPVDIERAAAITKTQAVSGLVCSGRMVTLLPKGIGVRIRGCQDAPVPRRSWI